MENKVICSLLLCDTILSFWYYQSWFVFQGEENLFPLLFLVKIEIIEFIFYLWYMVFDKFDNVEFTFDGLKDELDLNPKEDNLKSDFVKENINKYGFVKCLHELWFSLKKQKVKEENFNEKNVIYFEKTIPNTNKKIQWFVDPRDRDEWFNNLYELVVVSGWEVALDPNSIKDLFSLNDDKTTIYWNDFVLSDAVSNVVDLIMKNYLNVEISKFWSYGGKIDSLKNELYRKYSDLSEKVAGIKVDAGDAFVKNVE